MYLMTKTRSTGGFKITETRLAHSSSDLVDIINQQRIKEKAKYEDLINLNPIMEKHYNANIQRCEDTDSYTRHICFSLYIITPGRDERPKKLNDDEIRQILQEGINQELQEDLSSSSSESIEENDYNEFCTII